jgi:predicted dinucleotide-binding enzyme
MNVGILGTGDVARALGKGFIALGHAVKMGARIGMMQRRRSRAS